MEFVCLTHTCWRPSLWIRLKEIRPEWQRLLVSISYLLNSRSMGKNTKKILGQDRSPSTDWICLLPAARRIVDWNNEEANLGPEGGWMYRLPNRHQSFFLQKHHNLKHCCAIYTCLGRKCEIRCRVSKVLSVCGQTLTYADKPSSLGLQHFCVLFVCVLRLREFSSSQPAC